jgi:hypothetical protein
MTSYAPDLPASGRRLSVLTRPHEVLAALVLVWAAAVTVFAFQGEEWVWPVGLWATVTSIMTWPVLRGTGRPYLSYRRPLFLLGVAGMAGLPLLVWALTTGWSSEVKFALLLAVVFELGVTAFFASLPPAVGRPVPMLFKPDLVFGDGRLLVAGIIALLLGTRLLVFDPNPEGFPLPVPAGSWYGLLFAIGLGIVPIIPLRGVGKILLRHQRMARGRMRGPLASGLRELVLVVGALDIMYGFHAIFAGANPFADDLIAWSWGGFGLVLASAAVIVVGRGILYKRWVGDPFVKETPAQALGKHLLLLLGLGGLAYGFVTTVTGEWHGFGSGWALGAGIPLLAFAALLLVPGRMLAQHVQRRSLMAQMMATVLPSASERDRRALMAAMLAGVAASPPRHAARIARGMLATFAALPEETRAFMTEERTAVLAALPSETRRRVMRAMDAAMFGQAG